jgi:SAM-dependent methyltransferase
MESSREFEFGDKAIAEAYDTVLVNVLFRPWAAQLVEEYGPWEGHRVLDLATGTGIVAELLGERVGPGGKVIGADINGEMLGLARKRCADARSSIEFIESPAHPLACPSESVDAVVCQQGFQFFPDKPAAAAEVCRVLERGGRAIVTTWRPVGECEFFGAICGALEAIGEADISAKMRVPFDFTPEEDLIQAFESAGFLSVALNRQERPLVVDSGMAEAVVMPYSMPIGPDLRAVPKEQQDRFKEALSDRLDVLSTDGITMGRMGATLLYAEKPA